MTTNKYRYINKNFNNMKC